MDIKNNLSTAFNNARLHIKRKWKFTLAAAILVVGLGIFWLFFTNTGWLARNSFAKSFDNNPNRIVKIYVGSELINEYFGAYSVEQYQGYLVLINHKNETRTNIYGNVVAIVDAPKEDETQGE